MNKLNCPACGKEYTKSLSPLGKTWYDCHPCNKTKEELDKEYENRLQDDQSIKVANYVELNANGMLDPTTIMSGPTYFSKEKALDPNRTPEEGDTYCDDDGVQYVYCSGQWMAIDINAGRINYEDFTDSITSSNVQDALDELEKAMYDTHDEWNTGDFIWVAQESGLYEINAVYVSEEINVLVNDRSVWRSKHIDYSCGRFVRSELLTAGDVVKIEGCLPKNLNINIHRYYE